LRSPFSALAASTALQSFESGTMWPSTKPPATSARRKGHGLSGDTAISGLGAPPEAEPTRSSGMGFNPQNTECKKGIDSIKTGRESEARTCQRPPLEDVWSFGGIQIGVNRCPARCSE
jgi:hypothetical protein